MSDLLTKSSVLIRALIVAAIVGIGAHHVLQSQQPQPAASPTTAAAAQTTIDPATLQSLQALKTANEKLLKKQQGLLERMEKLEEDVRQLRIFAKRS